MKTFPKQRLSYQEKSANDFKWAKDVLDSIISQHAIDPNFPGRSGDDYNRMLSNYQLYNNILNQRDFETICNPLGLEVGQFSDAILPYNKTYNKIQVLLGDELSRPFSFKAVLVNSEGVKSKLLHRDYLLRQFVYSKIQTIIQELGSTDKEFVDSSINEILPPDEVDKLMKTSYLDAREILSNKILNYLYRVLLIKSKKNDAYKHALIAGAEYVYVGEENNLPCVDILNPLGVFYHKSPETKYVQDALYAGYRTYMTSGEILDRYADFLSEADLKKIDSTFEGKFGMRADFVSPAMQYGHDEADQYWNGMLTSPMTEGSYLSSNPSDDHLVYHVEWRSQRKVGFLTFSNEFGDEQTEIVSEDFEIPSTATKQITTGPYNMRTTSSVWNDSIGNYYSLEWKYIPEIWTGTKIGADIYTMIGPKTYQFRRIDEPYAVKLGYHGVAYSAMNAPSISLMDRMKPYQYLYFIVMHKLKKLIAQDQGKVFHFDVTMIDPEVGLEKTLYYLKELNIDFYNPLQNADQPGQGQRGKVHGTSDWSNMQHILNYVSLLDALDYQISDVAGVTKSREGQTAPNEAVTNAQSNITMSALITEIFFQMHQDLWESVLDSLLDVALRCFRGKNLVKQYILDDMSLATLELTTDSLDSSDLGIFVSNSNKDLKIQNMLESVAEALIRAGKTTFSDLIKSYKATSTEDLERQISASEEKAYQRESEAAQRQIDAAKEAQKAQQEFELLKQSRELETKLAIAEMQTFSFQKDQDIDNNKVPDQLEIAKFKADIELKNRALDLKEDELEIKKKAAKGKPTQ